MVTENPSTPAGQRGREITVDVLAAERKKFCPYCMSRTQEGEPCPMCNLTEGSYAPLPHHLPPGTVLKNRYLIGRVLGEGGFGITYIGRDLVLDMKVAIKEYYPTQQVTRTASVTLDVTNFASADDDTYQQSLAKFLREARLMARMRKQSHIVSVQDYFEANSTAYIVMQYVQGTTLAKLMEQRGGRIPAKELLDIMEPLFGALDEMHREGLVHRDISPENLMLEKGNIILLDFGSVREDVVGRQTLSIVLKFGYAPIEQYQGSSQGAWTDVYALGATMYHCMTGQLPPQSIDRLMEDRLIPPRKLGAELTERQEQALLYSMGIRPKRRFQSMGDFYNALYKGVAPTPKSFTLQRVSAGTDAAGLPVNDGNSHYSLAGAQYRVFADGGEQEILTTNSAGCAFGTRAYNVGTVLTITEASPSPGFNPDTQPRQLKISDGDNSVAFLCRPTVKQFRLKLLPAEGRRERGAANLEDGKYEVFHEGELMETLTTGADGSAVSAKYYTLGTSLTIREVQAPPGGKPDTQSHSLSISDGENTLRLRKEAKAKKSRYLWLLAAVLAAVLVFAPLGQPEPTESSEEPTVAAEAPTQAAAMQTTAPTEVPTEAPTENPSEPTGEDTAALPAELEALFADAQTFTGSNSNWQEFASMLEDDSVPAIIISDGTLVTTFAQVTITKPVLVAKTAFLGAWETVTVDGEDACLCVLGDIGPSSVLRTVNGGRIILEDGSIFDGDGGCALWLESESDFIAMDCTKNLRDTQIAVCSERALRSQATQVATAEEFTAALNDDTVTAIAVVGDITLDAGGSEVVFVPVPLIIEAGASLTVTGTDSYTGWDAYLFMGSDACLLNYGVLNAFVNTGHELQLVVNGPDARWTGGTFNQCAVMINYGSMTTEQYSCISGVQPIAGGTPGEAGLFYNEGKLAVSEDYFYMGNSVFCNCQTGVITIGGQLRLDSGICAINHGTIQVNKNAAFYSNTTLTNYAGKIFVTGGGEMTNGGVLINWTNGTVRALGTLRNADNGLIITATDADFTTVDSPGGRVETVPSLDNAVSGDGWVVVTTGEELVQAMDDPSVQGVYFNMKENCTVSGDLTVTKPLVLRNWTMWLEGTLTVADGYIASMGNTCFFPDNIVLEEGTFAFFNSNLGGDDVTVKKDAVFYFGYFSYPRYEGPWYGVNFGQYGGQINLDGGTMVLLSPITLEKSIVTIRDGGTLRCTGYLTLNDCNVDVGEESNLSIGAYAIDETTIVTNNGYMSAGSTTMVDYRVDGTVVNNGAMLLSAMDVYGTLENNGSVYYSGADFGIAITAKGTGEIRGNEILPYTSDMGTGWMTGK